MSTELDSIVADVSEIISALAPFVEVADPAWAPAIVLGTKIVQGAMAAEPIAVSLYNQFASGTPVTPQQLQDFSVAYEASYQQANNDINAALAKLPPG